MADPVDQGCDNDYVMGDTSCRLTILDVAQAMQDGYACITGGKAQSGASLVTFYDKTPLREVSDDEYKSLVTYLTAIPTLHEADMGFVIIIDRRQNGWGSVKTVLLRISGFFPGLVHEVFVLRPTSFFQRHMADVGYKMVKDDFKFKVYMLNSVEELYTHVDRAQLPSDFGGDLEYNHEEWVQQRMAVEKFSMNTHEISQALRQFCDKVQETEFPNDVAATERLITEHHRERDQVVEDLTNTVKHGDILLRCFKSIEGDGEGELLPTATMAPCKQLHITAIERLLVQLDETRARFDDFWDDHDKKLTQCLQLRQFEEDFKQLQYAVEQHLATLEELTETPDTIPRIEVLWQELVEFETKSKTDVERSEKLKARGDQFCNDEHYAMDCIEPKCSELGRMTERYWELLSKRHMVLDRCRDLQQRLEKANKWCGEGTDLLAGQQLEQFTSKDSADTAMKDIEEFLDNVEKIKLSDPKEYRATFEDIITPDMKTTVQSVLKRIADVQDMCLKRRNSLKKVTSKYHRPVQPVSPEPAPPTREPPPPPQQPEEDRRRWKHSKSDKNKLQTTIEVIRADGLIVDNSAEINSNKSDKSPVPSPTPSPTKPAVIQDLDLLQAKRGHVMKELIDTERAYVQELKSILEGYAAQFENPAMMPLMPPLLVGQKDAVFGNMQQIYDFHSKYFLKDLEDCRNTPALVGRCFVDRKEDFQMYSTYCQNKPRSEALRKEVGDNHPFFKECQQKLGHQLPLSAYLLKPVQRVTKYQLLLKEMLRFTQDIPGCVELKDAVSTMLEVLKYVNDAMNQLAIIGFKGDISAQGRLLMQQEFIVRTEHKKDKIKDLRFKPMQRHIFLYERLVLLCKRKEDPHNPNKASYYFKNALETARVGLTENVKGDKKKFELWLHGRAEVFIIQAPSIDVKKTWVEAIKRVLMSQLSLIKENTRHITDVSTIPINRNGSAGGEFGNNNHDLVEEGFEDDGWASAEFSEDELLDDSFDTTSSGSQGNPIQFIALAEYVAGSESELSMKEGDIVEVLRYGTDGWWYVQSISSADVGWVPKSYVRQCKHRSQSDMSVCSAGSATNGLTTTPSRNSLISRASSATESLA